MECFFSICYSQNHFWAHNNIWREQLIVFAHHKDEKKRLTGGDISYPLYTHT